MPAPLPVDDGYKVIASERSVSRSRLLSTYRSVHPIADANKLAVPVSADERASPVLTAFSEKSDSMKRNTWQRRLSRPNLLTETASVGGKELTYRILLTGPAGHRGGA